MTGKTISHYRIEEKLGGGGMGTVYRAHDTLLDRKVALKVILPELLTDQEAVNQFLREAKAASALNHPNILTVHDFVDAEGGRFIVMELVEGETLRQKIPQKGLEPKDLLSIAIEVADALSAAHMAEIIHRDLKPENIMVRTDGRIKVVDFGLAKLLSARRESAILASNESTLPLRTFALRPIERSQLAGTLPYMSPEQLQGKPADQRSDIFSFGVVLYEMATGQQPFQGRTSGEIIQSIVEKDPRPITDLSRLAPEKVQEIVSKCLEKDPADRYQHMEDVVVDLRRVRRSTGSAQPLPIPVTQRAPATKISLVLVVAVFVIGLVGLLAYLLSRPPKQELLMVAKWEREVDNASVSPDGKVMAFDSDTNGQREVYVMLTKGGPAKQITDGPGDKSDPRFSPDGTEILYCLERERKEIWKISTFGMNPQVLFANANSADWSPDGLRTVYAREATGEPASLWVSDLQTGKVQNIYKSKFEEISYLRWSPDGRWIFFSAEDGFFVITPEGPDGTKARPVQIPQSVSLGGIAWSGDSDYLLYSNRDKGIANIWKTSINDGHSVKVTGGAGDDFDPMPVFGEGGIIYANGRPESTIFAMSLKDGRANEVIRGGWYEQPTISPDGRYIAYLDQEPGGSDHGDLWVSASTGANPSKITTEDNCWSAAWSPDSTQLAYSVLVGPDEPKRYHTFTIALSEKTPHQLTNGQTDDYVTDWGQGGDSLLCVRVVEGKYALISINIKTGKETLVGPDFESGAFSPDGRWILAQGVSDEPERRGLWTLPSNGGSPNRIVSEAVGSSQWALRGSVVVYSPLMGGKGRTDIWKVPVSNGRANGTRSLLLSLPSTSSIHPDWDSTDNLSIVVYPRVTALANFYKLTGIK